MCKKLFFSLFLASVVVLSACATEEVHNNNETQNVGDANTDSITNDEEQVISSADKPLTTNVLYT